MTNILDRIVGYKKEEIAASKNLITQEGLKALPLFSTPVLSLTRFLKDADRTGIIAEFKRRSPSKGVINDAASASATAVAYAASGASAISVLTDKASFGGDLQDLADARAGGIPLLRKEFIIDEYQIIEAKAYGADVILLIAAILSPAQVRNFAEKAVEMGMEVILEIHDESELAHIADAVTVIGVNNRNLKTFQVDLDLSYRMSTLLPAHKLKISESGIHSAHDVQSLKRAGYDGFLIGENFMKQENPGAAFASFAEELKTLV